MLTHTLDIAKQIEKLQDLEHGWLTGDESALDKEGLAWLGNALKSKMTFTAQTLPHLYPTETGGVQAEWRLGDIAADLEVNLVTRQAIWGWSSLSSKDYGERELDLNSEDSWQWLAKDLDKINGPVTSQAFIPGAKGRRLRRGRFFASLRMTKTDGE